MRSQCLVVPRARAEEVRRLLRGRGALRRDLRVEREGEDVYFPISAGVDLGYSIVQREFRLAHRGPGSYRDLVDLSPELRLLLPSSFDVIGDVAVIKLPPSLQAHAGAVGAALLRAYPRLRSVAMDRGVGGSLRVRGLEVVAGEAALRTLHREHGLTLVVDPSRAYFSPRLATERMRVARQVRPGEMIVDMFAGVGPFSLVIARHARPARVYAVDANPEAFALLQENIQKNRVGDRVVPLLGDAREVVPGLGSVDRVIMDLPHSAVEFLGVALRALRPEGLLHYYEIMPRDRVGAREEELRGRARTLGRTLEILARREVRTYSPRQAHFALDLRVGVN